MRWLAYLHPLLMISVLALALFVLREGLRIRRARLAGTAFDSRRHRRLARWVVLLVVAGALAGLFSMGWPKKAFVLKTVIPRRCAHRVA